MASNGVVALPLAPPSYDDSAPNFLALGIVLGVASLAIVILRFVARYRSDIRVGGDDIFAVISLLGCLTVLGLCIWMSYNGAGYNPITLPFPVLMTNLQIIYIILTITPIVPAAARASILVLYNRIFNVHRGFRIAVIVVAIINAIWYIGCTVSLICACIPVQAAWNPLLAPTARCINTRALVLAAGIPDTLLDFGIIALPLGVLRTLQMPLRHKIGLSIIFLLGGFAGVIGIIRIVITYMPQEFSSNDTFYWLCIQDAICVICCCLPAYRTLVKTEAWNRWRVLYSNYISRIRTSLSSQRHHEPSNRSTNDDTEWISHDRFQNFQRADSDKLSSRHHAVPSADAGSHRSHDDSIPLKNINVHREGGVV